MQKHTGTAKMKGYTKYRMLNCLVILLFVCIAAKGQLDSFTWPHINVDIEIEENGDLLVSEEQKCSFRTGHKEQWHARFRWFPMDRLDAIRDVESPK